jgi:hypothetical protein
MVMQVEKVYTFNLVVVVVEQGPQVVMEVVEVVVIQEVMEVVVILGQ